MRRLSIPTFLLMALLVAILPGPAAAQSLNLNPTVNQLPDLTANLSVSASTVGGGDQVIYTLTIQNPGLLAFVDRLSGRAQYWNTPATGISLLQTLPGGITFKSVTASGGFACAYVAPVVNCTGGSLVTNASATITTTIQAPKTAGIFTSSATIDPTNAIVERSETNNSASASVNVPQPDLSVSISASDSATNDGGFVSFYVRVDNVAPAAEASGVTVRYTLPTGATLWSAGDGEPGWWPSRLYEAGFSCSSAGVVVTCTGGRIGSGATGAITLGVNMPRTNGVVTGTAVVDPNNSIAEQNEANNSAMVSTTINGRPDLALEVTHSILPTFSRNVIIRNLGVGPASDVRLEVEATKWEYFDDGGPDLLLVVITESGFSCSVAPYHVYSYINYHSGDVVTCTGGNIPAGGMATIHIWHVLTTVDDSRNTSATVDPNNAIREANETNNHAEASTRI